MFTRLNGLRRVNFAIGCTIIRIYIRRILRLSIDAVDFSYLAYYNFLIRCNLVHVKELTDSFIVKTSSNILLDMRKYPSSDMQILLQIWKDEEYRVVVDLIKKHLKSGELRIVDAGANVGYSSVFLFQELKSSYHVNLVCIEPGTGNFEQIKRNFELNGIRDFTIEKAGLYNKNCYLQILTDFRDGKDCSLRVEEVSQETDLVSVELQTVMERKKWDYVDFCKVDIEGSEKYLFQDEDYAQKFLRNIKIISIEIHDELGIEDRICMLLTKNNFAFFKHGEITVGVNKRLITEKENSNV